jgi:hypothetical protein
MIRIRTITMAITRRMWINQPIVGKAKKPIAQRITRMIAMVISM